MREPDVAFVAELGPCRKFVANYSICIIHCFGLTRSFFHQFFDSGHRPLMVLCPFVCVLRRL